MIRCDGNESHVNEVITRQASFFSALKYLTKRHINCRNQVFPLHKFNPVIFDFMPKVENYNFHCLKLSSGSNYGIVVDVDYEYFIILLFAIHSGILCLCCGKIECILVYPIYQDTNFE